MKKVLFLLSILCLFFVVSCSKKEVKSNVADGELAIVVNEQTINQILTVNGDADSKEEFVIECVLSGDLNTTIKKTVSLKDLEDLNFMFTDIPEGANVTVSIVFYNSDGSELYCGALDNVVMNQDLEPAPVNIVLGDSPKAKNKDVALGVEAPVSKTTKNDTTSSSEEDVLNEEASIIVDDPDFDFNANFEEALKASSGKTSKNKKQKESDEEKEVVLLPPDPVTSLKCEFNWKKNSVDLTWEEPADPELANVEIRNNKTKEVVIVPKGKKKYSFPAKGKEEQKFIVTTCSKNGLKGSNIGCSIKDTYLFTSFTAPTVANTGNGKIVVGEVKGINLDKYGIEEKDFDLSCPANSSVTGKSVIKRVDDETLSVTLAIPRRSGTFKVIVSCGNVEFNGYFTVLDYSSNSIGKVIYCEGEPEAIIAGYDSLGYPFGLGLKEGNSLKWAADDGFGYDYCFKAVVSHPSVVGVDSASKATFSGDIDGVDNWDAITTDDKKCKTEDGAIDLDYVEHNYPIFHYALNYGEIAKLPASGQNGWFVPSLSELCQIYKNREELNEVLVEIGGKRLKNEFYWSSSQNDYSNYNGCAVKFENGSIYKYYKKNSAVSVRCVKMYK